MRSKPSQYASSLRYLCLCIYPRVYDNLFVYNILEGAITV